STGVSLSIAVRISCTVLMIEDYKTNDCEARYRTRSEEGRGMEIRDERSEMRDERSDVRYQMSDIRCQISDVRFASRRVPEAENLDDLPGFMLLTLCVH